MLNSVLKTLVKKTNLEIVVLRNGEK